MTPYEAQQRKIDHITQHLTGSFPILDTSKTGTGKTYTALWAAKELGLKPFVVCPKSARSIWHQASEDLNIELDDVVNYEKLRYGTHDRMWVKKEKRVSRMNRTYINFHCQWKDPVPELVIFDEAHICAGMQSQNASMMIKTYMQRIPMLCLTATPADSPIKFKALGYITKLHALTNFNQWLESMGCRYVERRGWQFCGGRKGLGYMSWLNKTLTERNYMVQITANDIPAMMNEGIVIPELRNIDGLKAVNEKYDAAEDLAKFMEAAESSENAKMPIFIEEAEMLLEEGNSVVFFVNFHSSVDMLREAFKTAPAVTGKDKDRDEAVRKFQTNAAKVLICTTGAGSQAINLHDTSGEHPRVSLISPSFNAVHLIQSLGRTVRAGGKSPAIRKIIFAADTIEERAYKAVRAKINRIDTLCDGDLTTFEGGQN